MNSGRSAIARSDFAITDAPPSKAAAHRAPQSRLVTESRVRAALLLAPFLALLALFQWSPIGVALYNSFQDFSLLGKSEGWSGLQNYRDVVGSGEFQSSLALTLGFIAVKIIAQVFLGVAAALAVIRNNLLSFIVRSVVFLPTATAIVAVSLMFAFLFDRELGLVNAILGAVGLPRVAWLYEQRAAQSMMLMLSLWRDTGFVMLIFLSGLQSVPSSLLDAARVDGASWWQETRYVTLPLLVRSFQFAAVFATLAAVRFIAPIDIMTQGGPRQATNLASYHIYQQAFTYFAWGQTSAMSVILLLLLLVITASLMSMLRARWEY
jgi:ABC-type sugar transport system permease subunit